MGVALKREQPRLLAAEQTGQVKAIDGIEKEEGAHTLIEVIAVAPELIQGRALGLQVGGIHLPANGVEAAIALGGVLRCDDLNQEAHGVTLPAAMSRCANISNRRIKTSSRSCPLS